MTLGVPLVRGRAIAATDPATFASIAALMILVSLGASYIPARRAASVDPVSALRDD